MTHWGMREEGTRDRLGRPTCRVMTALTEMNSTEAKYATKRRRTFQIEQGKAKTNQVTGSESAWLWKVSEGDNVAQQGDERRGYRMRRGEGVIAGRRKTDTECTNK